MLLLYDTKLSCQALHQNTSYFIKYPFIPCW